MELTELKKKIKKNYLKHGVIFMYKKTAKLGEVSPFFTARAAKTLAK